MDYLLQYGQTGQIIAEIVRWLYWTQGPVHCWWQRNSYTDCTLLPSGKILTRFEVNRAIC